MRRLIPSILLLAVALSPCSLRAEPRPFAVAPDAPAATFGPPLAAARGTAGSLARSLAYVVDARSGATLARADVAVDAGNGIVFSPDGSRFVSRGTSANGLGRATEFRTTDLRPIRSLTATWAKGKAADVVGAFYGGRDGSLYAVVSGASGDEQAIAIVRAREPREPAPAPAVVVAGSSFVASGDGGVGFVLRAATYDDEYRPTAVTIDTLDLRTLARRSTVELGGELAAAFRDLEPSADGSELYLLGDVSRVRAVDSLTGRETRQIPTGWPSDPAMSLRNACAGGNALLVSAIGDSCDVSVPEGSRWVSDGALAPAPDVTAAVDAGGVRYGLDAADAVTRVLALGRDDRVVRRSTLRVPRLKPGQEMWGTSIAPSPDGSKLIVVLSFGEFVCPC